MSQRIDLGRILDESNRELAEQTDRPCAGCVFPRLGFDMVSLERGMNEKLVPTYLELRKEYVGF